MHKLRKRSLLLLAVAAALPGAALAAPECKHSEPRQLAFNTAGVPVDLQRVEDAQAFQAAHGDDPDRLLPALERAMDALLVGEVAAHGSRLGADAVRALLAIDIPLNAAGLAAWLRASARPAAP